MDKANGPQKWERRTKSKFTPKNGAQNAEIPCNSCNR